jgi:YfiH family protein
MNIKVFNEYFDFVSSFITDAKGGVSSAPYESLNLALHVGDNVKDVVENRAIVCHNNELILENLIYMDQTHSNNIQIIKDSSINKIPNCDALITNVKNIPLMVMVADCIPILMYDCVNNVIAVVHAGRESTFKKIAQHTIKKMEKIFNSKTKDILVYLGPSIHSCCYEISRDLADDTSKKFGKHYIFEIEGKVYLDLQTLNFDQLISVGVDEENINISKICTCCNKDYFSYRRDGVTGRFAGIIVLK